MTWGSTSTGTPVEAANQVKQYEVSHDHLAQKFGHVSATKEILFKALESLPETAIVSASYGGNTISEDTYTTWINITVDVGYAPFKAP